MTGNETFETVCALQSEGQYFVAHDLAMAALLQEPDHAGLQHRAVFTLAQAGSTASALALFGQLGLEQSADPEIEALGARLLKDAALDGAQGAARAAETAYGALWRRSGEAWHGMNAAAMALLAGSAARARERVAALGELRDDGSYWAAATIAEGALLRGEVESCARWLEIAENRAGSDYDSRRSTRRQLRWIAGLIGMDPALVDALRIPATVHYCGAIARAPGEPDADDDLRRQLDACLTGVRFGFGSLASGADIVIAEALLDRGAELTVVLPFPPDAFIATSVGPGWVPRFQACLARARVILLEAEAQDDQDFAMTSRRAMGLARMHAGRLDGPSFQVAVPAARTDPVAGVAGTLADMAGWQAAGGRTVPLRSPWHHDATGPRTQPPRMLHAVLFGDLPGFGKLTDGALAAFYDGPLPAIAPATAGALYRNAWGDAVQLVFPEAAAAAICALEIQRTLDAAAFRGWNLPGTLVPRLALDFGPLRPVHDAVQDVAKFAGIVMTRAARIEPVTPPGQVYATEAFACEMALLPDPPAACDYAGLVPTAKAFGTLPLYAVRRR